MLSSGDKINQSSLLADDGQLTSSSTSAAETASTARAPALSRSTAWKR